MARYSRTQLAEASGVPARTIRYYHSVGVLPKAARSGKETVYSDVHLERLRAIAEMQARGLRLEAIRAVFEADAEANPGGDWRALFAPPGDAPEVRLDDAGLAGLLGERGGELTDELLAAGYLRRDGDGWFVPDQAMLKAALVLYDVGTDIALSARLRTLVQDRIGALAEEIVDAFRQGAEGGYGGEAVETDANRFREQFRAVAWEVGGATLAAAIEQAAGQGAGHGAKVVVDD